MIEIDEDLKKALIKFYESVEVTPSTVPPGQYGIGGQMMTGWIHADTFNELFEALERSQFLRDYYANPR